MTRCKPSTVSGVFYCREHALLSTFLLSFPDDFCDGLSLALLGVACLDAVSCLGACFVVEGKGCCVVEGGGFCFVEGGGSCFVAGGRFAFDCSEESF